MAPSSATTVLVLAHWSSDWCGRSSLMRASPVANCHLSRDAFEFCSDSQALTSRRRAPWSGIRRLRHWRTKMLNSISGVLGQLPRLEVQWNSRLPSIRSARSESGTRTRLRDHRYSRYPTPHGPREPRHRWSISTPSQGLGDRGQHERLGQLVRQRSRREPTLDAQEGAGPSLHVLDACPGAGPHRLQYRELLQAEADPPPLSARSTACGSSSIIKEQSFGN